MKKLYKFYLQIQNVGVYPDLEESKARYIKMHNGLLAISAMLLSPFPFIFYSLSLIKGLYLCLLGLGIVTVPIIMNHYRYYFFARVISVLASLLIFLLGLNMFGINSGFEYGVLAVMVLPILYFKDWKSRLIIYFVMFSMLILSYLIVNSYNVDTYSVENLTFLRAYLFFSCILLIMFYFLSSDEINREYQRKNETLVGSLLQKNRELKRFSYSVSHDLKEPLRTISSFTHLLKRDVGNELSKDSEEYYQYIMLGTKQMTNLLDDVLDYSKLDNLEFEITDINLNTIVENVMNQLSSRLLEMQSELKFSELPIVKGTDTLLSQLFLNLISNAIKFRKSGQAFKLNIWSEDDINTHRIYIKDDGIGIEKEYQEKIFDIFKRLHPRYTYEGSGIGLSTCQRIMEKLKGEISIESELGNGATFILSFPRQKKAKTNFLLEGLSIDMTPILS